MTHEENDLARLMLELDMEAQVRVTFTAGVRGGIQVDIDDKTKVVPWRMVAQAIRHAIKE